MNCYGFQHRQAKKHMNGMMRSGKKKNKQTNSTTTRIPLIKDTTWLNLHPVVICWVLRTMVNLDTRNNHQKIALVSFLYKPVSNSLSCWKFKRLLPQSPQFTLKIKAWYEYMYITHIHTHTQVLAHNLCLDRQH